MLSDEEIKRIAEEYVKKGPTILAKEMGVSRQAISQIAAHLRELGVNIPYLKEKGRLKRIAREILEKKSA